MSRPGKVRLPDLWLKHEMAMALAPPGTKTEQLDNAAMARCVRGDQGNAAKFNKMIAGDDAVSLASDLHFFAATFSFVVLRGVPDRVAIVNFAEGNPEDILPLEAVLGTFSDFARALLKLVSTRHDYPALGGEQHFVGLLSEVARQNLHEILGKIGDVSDELTVLHGPTRHWTNINPTERIIRQPAFESIIIPSGHYVQLALPAGDGNRLLFGFELRADTRAILDDWTEIGSWFRPRRQENGRIAFLLPEFPEDHRNPRVEGEGEYWLTVIAIDMPDEGNTEASLPNELKKLAENHPVSWPEGYAEAIASVTYLSRLSTARKKVIAAFQRDEDRSKKYPTTAIVNSFESPVERARLYRARYRVA